MKAIVRMLLVVALAGTLVLIPFTPASAEVPVAYQVQPGDTLPRIAVAHQVTLKALMDANPEIRKPKAITPGQWLRLPGSAILPRQSFIALFTSGQFEIDEILKEVQVHAVYRIVGRVPPLGKWGQKSVIVAGSRWRPEQRCDRDERPADPLNVSVVGFVGIAGGGHDTLIGDACICLRRCSERSGQLVRLRVSWGSHCPRIDLVYGWSAGNPGFGHDQRAGPVPRCSNVHSDPSQPGLR